MRPVRILAVCGSGTVSSAMLSSKIKDYLKENGYGCDTVEMNSTGVELAMQDNAFDLIACTTPIYDYDIPILNAAGYIIGINEEEFHEALMEIVSRLPL